MEKKLSVRLPGHIGALELPRGRINRLVETAFTYGQCHAMALALSRALNAPLRIVISSNALASMKLSEKEFLALEEIPDRVVARHWDHAMVEIETGKYLDVHGVRTLSQLRGAGDYYQPSTSYVIPTTERQILELSATHRSGLRPNVAVAEHFAPLVIRKYLNSDGSIKELVASA